MSVVDFYTSNLASALETGLDAFIMGTGNLVTILAGENLARPIALNFVNVRDRLAVLAVGDVISKRRSNHATTT